MSFVCSCSKEGYVDPPPLRSGHIYMKDAQCAEINDKSYISDFHFSSYGENSSKTNHILSAKMTIT